VILVTGGTGTIGRGLVKAIKKELGGEVKILTRQKDLSQKNNDFIYWDPPRYLPQMSHLNIEGVIHLAGHPVFKIWTWRYIRKMLESRVTTLLILKEQIKREGIKLKFFIGMSSIAIYHKWGFLKRITQEWESSSLTMQEISEKVLIMRTGVVISPYGGLVKIMNKMLRLFPVVPVPTRKSFYWIDYRDLNNAVINFVKNDNNENVQILNFFNPEPLYYSDFIRVVLNITGIKHRFCIPVIPEPPYIINHSYSTIKFQHTDIRESVSHALASPPPTPP